jgi:hypothetical protein
LSNDWTEGDFGGMIEMMVPILFTLGPLVISPLTLLVPFAFMVASYLLWRDLREDYSEEEIIRLTIYLALAFLLGARLIHVLYHLSDFQFSLVKWFLVGRYPGFSFMGGFLASLGFLFFWSKKKDWDFWQLGEVVVPAGFLVTALVGMGLFLTGGEIVFLGEAVLAFLLLFFSRFLRKKYRTFVWYKSGKLGFVSCFSLSLFMLGKLLLEILDRGSLYWESLFLVGITIACWLMIYQRSGRDPKEDFGKILPRKKGKKE